MQFLLMFPLKIEAVDVHLKINLSEVTLKMGCCPEGTELYLACFKSFLLVVRSKKISSDSGLLDHPVDDSEDTPVSLAYANVTRMVYTPSHCRLCSHVWVWDAMTTVSLCLREGGG